jgi:hypothetical protein
MLPHWKECDLDVNGVKIHYVRTGDGNKPPLVLAVSNHRFGSRF